MTGKREIFELRAILLQQTDKAVRVTETGEAKHAVWLPLSEIEMTPGPIERGRRYYDLQIPEWLAIKKKLV